MDTKTIRPLTQKEKEAADALAKHGSYRKAADAIGISRGAFSDRIAGVKKAKPEELVDASVPQGMTLTKTTVQYDAQGNPVQEWRRLSPTQQSFEAFVDALIERVPPAKIKQKRKSAKASDLMLEVDIPDPHIGMYAWADLTGNRNYDVGTAKNLVLESVDYAINRPVESPDTIMIGFLGDILHSDNRTNQTEKSGNVLDVDGRYQRVVEYAEKTLTQSVDLCLERAKKVVVRVIPGNHDWHTAVCMARIVRAYYRMVKSVEVLVSPRPRNVYVWGKNMIGHAHGDCVKVNDWAKIIPSEFPEEWAATTFRYMHLGHIHKSKVISPVQVDGQTGITIEYLRALCPPDAWHCEQGYVGTSRGADSFLYHKEHGLIERYFYNA